MKKKNAADVIDNRYFELVQQFPLKQLESDAELDRATEIVNGLVDRGFENLTAGENAYLDVLSDLIEKYETAHHPIPDASPLDLLKFFIEERGTNQRAVAIGSRIAVSTMSELLAGRRQLNLEHIRKLADFFKIDPGTFVPRQRHPRTKDKKLTQRRHAGRN
jgi:HTH-type transcriptional regulator / antitoxin HigA